MKDFDEGIERDSGKEGSAGELEVKENNKIARSHNSEAKEERSRIPVRTCRSEQ